MKVRCKLQSNTGQELVEFSNHLDHPPAGADLMETMACKYAELFRTFGEDILYENLEADIIIDVRYANGAQKTKKYPMTAFIENFLGAAREPRAADNRALSCENYYG